MMALVFKNRNVAMLLHSGRWTRSGPQCLLMGFIDPRGFMVQMGPLRDALRAQAEALAGRSDRPGPRDP